MTHQETFYVIEWNEKGSYVNELEKECPYPKVHTLIGNPFMALRLYKKDIAETLADHLAYQGQRKARRHAKVVEVKSTAEIVI
jgi:hypothetical protein